MKNLCLSLVLFIFVASTYSCDTRKHSPNTEARQLKRVALAESPIKAKKIANEAVFDIPSLVGLTIDQIKIKLGKPLSDEQANVTATEKDCLYRSREYNLIINYYVKNRKVSLFFINNIHKKESYSKLLVIGNLDSAATRYRTIFSEGPATEHYPGIIVTTDTNL